MKNTISKKRNADDADLTDFCGLKLAKSVLIRPIRVIRVLLIVIGFNACGDWLDVVPEGMPTMEVVFNSKETAIKYLSQCYSYLPDDANPRLNPAMLGGDELWTHMNAHAMVDLRGAALNGWYIALGRQNSNAPLLGYWNHMYLALRECNIFLENVGKVPDLQSWEREQWSAEVKVLKAYYHFYLVQMYGPIPLIRESTPIYVELSQLNVEREPVDDCFRYIVELLDEAAEGNEGRALPMQITNKVGELGRITKPIALALKAKVLVAAASPLFNGNEQQINLRNHDKTPLFNTTYVPEKWDRAVTACREAIEQCRAAGITLYEYPNTGLNRYTDTIATQLSLREAFNLRYNSEIIWANVRSISGGGYGGLQQITAPFLSRDAVEATGDLRRELGVPMKIATMFYTDHGVPLEEDKTRDLSKLYDMRTATFEENLYIRDGDVTVDMHFDREPRFYAWIGFDGGIWLGMGRTDDKEELYSLRLKNGDLDAYMWLTGYLPKKFIPYENNVTTSSFTIRPHPWPIMRLSDLYLLYAEAINEVEGPNGQHSAELFNYINLVRARAGLDGVKESWDAYTKNTKYENKDGMREIIQQERMIELCFEGHRFWDVRRWKTAPALYRTPIEGWNYSGETDQEFYIRRIIFQQTFNIRDYFWPIQNDEIINNPKLVQNIDW